MCVILLYVCVCENILFAFQSPTNLFKVLPFAPRTRASSVRVRTSLLRKTLRLLLLLLPGPESPRDFNLSSGDDEPVCRFSRSTVFDFFLLHERLRASDWLAFTSRPSSLDDHLVISLLSHLTSCLCRADARCHFPSGMSPTPTLSILEGRTQTHARVSKFG